MLCQDYSWFSKTVLKLARNLLKQGGLPVSRRKGWMFFALGLVLALSAAAMVFIVLRNAEAAPPAAPPPIPTKQLPVAARPLEPGMKLSPADYIMKDFPLD